MDFCIDCNKIVKHKNSKRCRECYNLINVGINHVRHGMTHSKESKLKIGKSRIYPNKSKTPSYIDGRTLKQHYCIDCDAEISYKCWYYGTKKCRSCSHKGIKRPDMARKIGKLNSMYGKGVVIKKVKYKNIWMRSSWEIKFAMWMDLSNIKWKYEPRFFELKKSTYTPDFYLPEFDCYIEIKGYWRKDAKQKFVQFKKIYNNISIFLFNQKKLQLIGVI